MTAAYRGRHVQLDLPVVGAGATTRFSSPSDEEAALVLLAGDVEWNGTRATRTDVFDAPAAAVYLPPGSVVDVVAREQSEFALASTVGCALEPGDEDVEMVSPQQVVVHDRGRPPWQRTVHDVVAENVHAHRLIVGETFNEPGQWSSFPPHKHDGTDGEPALEEVYYFRFDRPGGFGFQGLYDASGDERAILLRHGSVVGIPHGYHPVAAAPGYRLYYLWALVGARRHLAMHEDPAHRWLHDTAN